MGSVRTNCEGRSAGDDGKGIWCQVKNEELYWIMVK